MTRLCRMIFAASAAMATAIAAAGESAVVEVDGNALKCGNARFVFMTDRMVRCEWSEDGAFEDRPTLTFVNRAGEPVAFSWERRGGGITARTGRMTLEWTGGAFCETNLFVNGVAALAEDADNLLGTQRTLDGKTCMADVLPTMEKGLLSRRGVTVVDDTATPLFVPAVGRNRKVWVAERPRRTGSYRDLTIFAYGHDYKGCLGDYVRFAGRIPLPPRWAFGYWWSRYWLYTDQEVRDLADDILSAGCPMDVFVIDMEWHETWNIVDRPDPDDEFGQMWGWTGYTWNKRLFPDPKSTLDYLHGKGCKVALNLHPASGVQPVEDCYAAFAADYGWTGTNAVPFRADEERWADCYFKDVIGPLERQGVDFWWLDWQQWKMSKEKPSLSNTFWLNHIFAEHSTEGGRRPFIYHRWGGLGSHRYQVGFSGDCKVSWGMLAAIPWFTATASNVGYGYWGHDIGGHHNPDNGDGINGELFTRWLQSGVFTPIFKTHSTKDATIERRIWKYPEHYSALRDAMRLRYRLAPYIYNAARQAYDTGVSMCRPLYYDSPEDEAAYHVMNEYMFGDDILAVTITNAMAKGETASQVDFHLPQGRWYDVSSGRLLDGGRRVSLRYAIDENPWLVKAGAIIPMYPESVRNLANPGTDNLEILFAPGATHGEASVYEDAGDNADYETNCRFTKIARDGWRIEIGPRAGAYTLRFPLVAAPRSVRVCGKTAKWRWDARDFALVVETPRMDGSSATVVEIEPCDGADEIERALAGMKGAQREVNAVTEEFKAALRKVHWAVNLPVSWQEFWQTPAAIAARPDDAISLLAHRKAAFREFMEKDFPRFRDKLPPSLAERILNMEAKVFLKRNDLPSEGQERPTGELQEKAQALADLAVKEGLQGALQFCAYKDGKCIVDVWAGTMTTNAGAAKIDGDTLFPIFSTEKPLLATAMHRSVERGKLEYDKPVCNYWPEFRGGGKENLTVRELMGYRSGLPDCKPGTGWNDFATMSDWKGMLEWYASCEPQIEPGTKQRYMPKSYGWALGGLLEKAWGRPANDILREQVLIPAGIEKDFYFVCGDDEISRIATVYNGEAFESMNNDIARRSLLPSAWAVSSARGIAKFYNRLCGFDGKPPLIGRETLDAALKPCRHESDPLPDAEGMKKWHMIFGMGYGLWGETDDISRVFGHGGIGGSEGLCDRSQRLVIGYTCNFDNAPPKLREAFYSLVGMRWRYWKDDVNIQDLQMATVAKGNDASANSVASFCERAEKGERLTVAFLGGSLSWGANATDPNKTSWRALIGRRLEERYPDARFKFVDAAIGGTGSGLGIFRLERDVIPYKPDIVFVDCLVNDGERKADDDSSCSYEGIIRHLMERLPECVPVQVMLPTRGTIEEPDASKLVRWDEQKRIGAAYGLGRADVLGEMRRRHAAGAANLDRMWPAWPALLGDTTHPHDYGYSVYADIIWDQIFAKPSDKSPTMPDEWLFAPKYRHVVRENVAAWKDLPKGWHNDACYVRAGTFDFLCSRWQDGLAVAANCTFNPKTCKREFVTGVVEPLRAKFRGEVLMLYGESAEWSPKCEVFVDGKLVVGRDTADFGRMFAPTAYLVWKIGVSFDANAEHTLEIRPVFADGKPQEFRLGSICVAGRDAAWVRRR